MLRNKRLGMSPRQQRMDELWSWFRGAQYDRCYYDWDGRKIVKESSLRAQIYSGEQVPPGFTTFGLENYPLDWRKPRLSYNLPKVVVNRFTGMLFGQSRHPKLHWVGDRKTESFMKALLEEVGRFWATWAEARNHGGAQGTACISFQFLEGRLRFTVHNPTWVDPKFRDGASLDLESLEVRYQYPVETWNEERSAFEEVPYWYRRVIDGQKDIVFEPVPVGAGDEPYWTPKTEVEHGFGFCPAVWVQNLPLEDDIDGVPDCEGIYDDVPAMDRLLSQAFKGVETNCDPTLIVGDKGERPDTIKKGSDNAIIGSESLKAEYLELSGEGAKVAMDLFEKKRQLNLEVVQCVLDHPDAVQRTATEVDRVYSSMLDKVGQLREQYGEHGIKPLAEKVYRAVQSLLERDLAVVMPPQEEQDEQEPVGEHELGDGRGWVTVEWPKPFEPSPEDEDRVITTSSKALVARIFDLEEALKYVSRVITIEDRAALLGRLNAAMEREQSAMESQILEGVRRK
jgi:hypothetical protein